MSGISSVRRDLAILYLAVLVTRVGFGVIIIIFPAYIAQSSDIAVAGALALYPVFEAVAAVPIGRFCDVRGRKVVFAYSLGYMAALLAAVGLTRNFFAIAGLHALMGIGAAGITVSSLTMITDLTHEDNRGAGMGTFDFANIGGYAFGLLLGGRLEVWLSTSLGYAFILTALAVGGAFVIGARLLREPKHLAATVKPSLNPFKALDPKAKAILPIWISLTALIGIVFFLPRALERLGVGGGVTSILLFVGVVVIGCGSVGFGALSDRYGRPRVMLVGIVGLLVLLATAGLSFGEGPGAIVRNFPVIGASALATSALVPSILATVGDRSKDGMKGLAMGLYSVMLSGGIAVGTLVAGVAHNYGGLSATLDSGALIFVSACAISLVLWERAK